MRGSLRTIAGIGTARLGVLAAVAVMSVVGLPFAFQAVADGHSVAWLVGLAVGVVLALQTALVALLLLTRADLGRLRAAASAPRDTAGEAARSEGGQQDRRLLEGLRRATMPRADLKALIKRDNDRTGLDTARQVQATVNLFGMLDFRAEVPPLGGWAASPDVMLHLVQTLLDERPACVVECGSGSSTLFLALTARQHDLPVRIVALEHDPAYAAQTRALLARHGVADLAEVRTAELTATGLAEQPTPWYDVSALDGLEEIGLLFVDGPPESLGDGARYPAFPLLRDRLAQRCTVIMDDFRRPAEKQAAERWLALAPEFTLERVPFQKGAGILRRG